MKLAHSSALLSCAYSVLGQDIEWQPVKSDKSPGLQWGVVTEGAPATFLEAKKICSGVGATLAMMLDDSERQEAAKMRNGVFAKYDPIIVGASIPRKENRETTCILTRAINYRWVNGEPVRGKPSYFDDVSPKRYDGVMMMGPGEAPKDFWGKVEETRFMKSGDFDTAVGFPLCEKRPKGLGNNLWNYDMGRIIHEFYDKSYDKEWKVFIPDVQLDWFSAYSYCLDRGAQLMTIFEEIEEKKLMPQIWGLKDDINGGLKSFYVGAMKAGDKWSYLQGKPFKHTYYAKEGDMFAVYQQYESYAQLETVKGESTGGGEATSDPRYFICEIRNFSQYTF